MYKIYILSYNILDPIVRNPSTYFVQNYRGYQSFNI